MRKSENQRHSFSSFAAKNSQTFYQNPLILSQFLLREYNEDTVLTKAWRGTWENSWKRNDIVRSGEQFQIVPGIKVATLRLDLQSNTQLAC